jgi:hypothetical protein
LDLEEYDVDVGKSSTQMLRLRTPTEEEVAGAVCNGSRKAVIVLFSENEGSTPICPICFASYIDALLDQASSLTK